MSPAKEILLITTESESGALDWIQVRHPRHTISILDFHSHHAVNEEGPNQPRRLSLTDYVDLEQIRGDFLSFLDSWPRRPLARGKCFDDLFSRRGGYSVWWTGPGADRVPDEGLFPKMKALWICNRAIEARQPDRVVVDTADAELAGALATRCAREHRDYDIIPGVAGGVGRQPRTSWRWRGRNRWLVKSLVRTAGLPCLTLLRALAARVACRFEQETPLATRAPAVVFASSFDGHVQEEKATTSVGWWRELQQPLAEQHPSLRQRYLLHVRGRFGRYRPVAGIFHTAWTRLNRARDTAPITDLYPCLRVQLASLLRQVRALFRYARLERSDTFRESFSFAGADVSGLYVPRLRRAISRSMWWELEVAATQRCLQAVGNVKAVVVADEMYRAAMRDIAAAGALGIPTIGVQHGIIFPTHVTYTLPPGHMRGAPVPDFLAVHGPYARDVLTACGSFPKQRVWVSGPWKHDSLIAGPADTKTARQRLGLPMDKAILLVTTQIFPWYRCAVQAILEATKDQEDVLVCLKPHPRDPDPGLYRRIAEEVGARHVRFFDDRADDLLSRYNRFRELLPACDVLLSASSTTILEAILLGRPTICLNFSGEPDWFPYVEDGGSLAARSAEQLQAALRQALSQEESARAAGRRRFLRRHVAAAAETPYAARLAQNIVSLCSTKPPRRTSDGRRHFQRRPEMLALPDRGPRPAELPV